MPTNISTIKLSDTAEWAKKLSFGRNFNISTNQEPALTSANIIMQTILGPPFTWMWNITDFTFVCSPGSQDYTLNIPTFAWIDWASVQDTTNNKWFTLQAKGTLALDSTSARPTFITPTTQNTTTGDVTFRVMPNPDKTYTVRGQACQSVPLFTSMNQTWSPIPDRFAYIYSWGFLSLMWLFADDPRWTMANQKFIAHLLGASQGLTETEMNIFLANWDSLTTGGNLKTQQGFQGRAV